LVKHRDNFIPSISGDRLSHPQIENMPCRDDKGENRGMRIFGPKKDEVTEDWRKLVLFIKYNLNDKVKEDEMDGTCSTHGGEGECL
jgi:hypothetical protein